MMGKRICGKGLTATEVKYARSRLENMKFLFAVSLGANPIWRRVYESDPHWYRHAWFWGMLLGYLFFSIYISKSHQIDRVILYGVAWEKRSIFNILFTTLLLYGLFLVITLLSLAFIELAEGLWALKWYDDIFDSLVFAGILTIIYRFFDCMERFFYY